jgi:nucleoid-associated protein YgaU
MRITNLHLIISFFLLSAAGFFLYSRYGRSPLMAPLPLLTQVPPAPPVAAAPAPDGPESPEALRRQVDEVLANAFSDIEVARSLGFDVTAAEKIYNEAQRLLPQAATVEQLRQVKTLGEQSIQLTLGTPPQGAPAAPPAAETTLAPPEEMPLVPTAEGGEALPGLGAEEPLAPPETAPTEEPPPEEPGLEAPAAPPVPPQGGLLLSPGREEYVVQPGDNLWAIAKRPDVYGRGAKWVRLWRANEKDIPDFDKITSGMVLSVPAE